MVAELTKQKSLYEKDYNLWVLEMVEKLIALGEDINQKSNGKTPLQYAARYNRVEIAKLLLENGAKLNAKCDKGYTALKYAELSKATDVAQLLKSYKE